jgi:hypothetical protein
LDLENETQKRHIEELQRFVTLLSSALGSQEQIAHIPQATMIETFAKRYSVGSSAQAKKSTL